MTLCQSLVCLCSLGKRIRRSDWHFELRSIQRTVQSFKLTHSGNCIVRLDCYGPLLFWPWLHSIRIGNAASASKRMDTFLESVTSRKREHCINSLWRKATSRSNYVLLLSIYGPVGAQTPHQCFAIRT